MLVVTSICCTAKLLTFLNANTLIGAAILFPGHPRPQTTPSKKACVEGVVWGRDETNPYIWASATPPRAHNMESHNVGYATASHNTHVVPGASA